MIQLTNKATCCGCTACANVCPKCCIVMKQDEEGFLYPGINSAICNNCGLCDKVCPILKEKRFDAIPTAYLCRAKNSEIVASSTSGGVFSPIAQYVLNNGGVVFGASFNEEWKVLHNPATSMKNAAEFRGSKYVQSDLGKTFYHVKKYLDQGRWVCFSGTPCHVSGLIQFLPKKYVNLITVDFVCRGTPSPLFWKKYTEYQEFKFKSKVISIKFRNKTYGYHSSTMKIEFENGQVYFGSSRVDLYLKSFFHNVCSRLSCYQCKFKTIQHHSDFTLFDSWHASNVVESLKDDDKGYTNVLLQSDKGLSIFDEIKPQLHFYPVDIQQAVKYDGIMICNSVPQPTKREKFLTTILNTNVEHFEQEILGFIQITLFDRLWERIIKPVLFYLNILSIVKKNRV